MNNQLQIFNNAEFGQVRVLNQDRELLFVGQEVDERLGYKDTFNNDVN